MALNTYAGLQAAVSSWMGIQASDISTKIADLVTIAEARIFREARTKDQEATLSVAISAQTAALPSDYVALKYAYVNTSPIYPLEMRSAQWLYKAYPQRSSSGIPCYIAREASTFIFGPSPDSGYTITGVYYATQGPLSSTTYNLFLNNPDLYLFACLAESEVLVGRDSRLPLWEAKYQKILSDVNGFSMGNDHSGGVLTMRLA